MAKRQQTKGAYGFCGREMTRSGLTRHLQTCSHRPGNHLKEAG